MSSFGYYLITINILGFVLLLINTLHTSDGSDRKADIILAIISLLGGSVGILLSMLIFARRVEKDNIMSKVFIACVFIIQTVLFLIINGHIADDITIAFWTFLNSNEWLIVYIAVVNSIAFAAFAADKIAAIGHRSRIRIVTLLSLAFIGGSLGSLLAMYIFRHKTRQNYFTVGIPLIIIMQAVVLFYAMNASW